MAATTIKAIIDRFQAVIEASPISLTATVQPFSFDTQPATALDDRYWVEDAGLSESQSVTNNAEVRIDRLTVWLALRHTLGGQSQAEALEATLVNVERYIVADGPANSYAATMDGREIQRKEDTGVILAALAFLVDYDYTLSTS